MTEFIDWITGLFIVSMIFCPFWIAILIIIVCEFIDGTNAFVKSLFEANEGIKSVHAPYPEGKPLQRRFGTHRLGQ